MSNRNGFRAVLVAAVGLALPQVRGDSPPSAKSAPSPSTPAARPADAETSDRTAAPLETRPGAIIYRNGRVVAGNIHETPRAYIIVRDVGRIAIPREDVEHIADSMDDAYLYKLSRTNPLDPGEHMELAQWCWLVHLERRAIEQLDRVLELKPQDRRALQLKKLVQRPQATPGPNAVTGNRQTASEPAVPAARLPQNVFAGTRTEPTPEAVGEFVRRVQPLLARSCGATGCHGAGHTGAFQLDRVARPTPRTTQHNLESTLAQIDYESPAKSPLLERALRPHGAARAAPLPAGTRHPAYATLSQWVQQVVDPLSKGAVTATAGSGADAASDQRTSTPASTSPEASRPPGPVNGADSDRTSGPAVANSAEMRARGPGHVESSPSGRVAPRPSTDPTGQAAERSAGRATAPLEARTTSTPPRGQTPGANGIRTNGDSTSLGPPPKSNRSAHSTASDGAESPPVPVAERQRADTPKSPNGVAGNPSPGVSKPTRDETKESNDPFDPELFNRRHGR